MLTRNSNVLRRGEERERETVRIGGRGLHHHRPSAESYKKNCKYIGEWGKDKTI